MLTGIDLDLQLECGLRINFGRELEHQVYRVSGLGSIALAQPRERIAGGVDRADGLRLCLDQVDIFRVRRPSHSILWAQDQVEAASGSRQTLLPGHSANGGNEYLRTQAKRRQRLFPGEAGAATGELLIKILIKRNHSPLTMPKTTI